jgi:hypothetical protein
VLAKLSLATAALLGVAAIANGLTMLVSPHGWYLGVPGVPMSGPFNPHFVRDIGVVFVLVGSAFVGGIAVPLHRALLWTAATAWLVSHASLHLWQVAVGISDHAALGRDFPPVTLPALLGLLISSWAFRAQSHRAGRLVTATA